MEPKWENMGHCVSKTAEVRQKAINENSSIYKQVFILDLFVNMVMRLVGKD